MFRRSPVIAAALLALGLVLGQGVASAHHSFAAFFDPDRVVRVTGKVTAFRFANPHGTIALDVTTADGKVEKWWAETNAPVVLVRRGWTRTIIKPGDIITIEGWPSRDGKPYVRLQRAYDASGKPIGQTSFGKSDE